MTMPPETNHPAARATRVRILPILVASVLGGSGTAAPRPAEADDGGSVDDVMMQVVDDPAADERDYVDEIELPPAAREAMERRRGASDTRRQKAEAPGAARSAREAARAAREAAESAREGRGRVEGAGAERVPEAPGSGDTGPDDAGPGDGGAPDGSPGRD